MQKIGLTRNQATVYLALFRAGEARAGALIKKTSFHRNLVYSALSELMDKKLVSVSKVRGVAVYKVLAPSSLLGEIQERESVAKDVIRQLSSLSRGNAQEIIVYEGIDEFRRQQHKAYSLARPGGLARYLGTSPRWFEIMGPSLAEELQNLQIDKKLRIRMLTATISEKDKQYIHDTKGLSEIKKHALIATDTNVTEILEDRIAIRSYIEPYFVVEIVHPQLAKNYQNYFDFLWKQSK